MDFIQQKIVNMAIANGYKSNDFVKTETLSSKWKRVAARAAADVELAKPGIGTPKDLIKRARTSILHEEDTDEEPSIFDALKLKPEELIKAKLEKEYSAGRSIMGLNRD